MNPHLFPRAVDPMLSAATILNTIRDEYRSLRTKFDTYRLLDWSTGKATSPLLVGPGRIEFLLPFPINAKAEDGNTITTRRVAKGRPKT